MPPQRSPAHVTNRLDRYSRVEEELTTEIGVRVREARLERRLSQAALGDALGYAATMIAAIEKGRRRLKVDDLARVCIVLNKTPDYFLWTETLRQREPRSVSATLRAEFAALSSTTLAQFTSSLLDEIEAAAPISSSVPILHDLQPEAAAREILDFCDITGPPVHVADDICERFGVPVYWRDVPDAMSALLLRLDGGDFVIAVNEGHSGSRRRFSVAHELGHAVLGHDGIYYLDWDEHAGNVPHYRYNDEREANGFAAALLMDARWVRKDFSAGLRDPTRLARRYAVSEAAMGFRLVNLGLT